MTASLQLRLSRTRALEESRTPPEQGLHAAALSTACANDEQPLTPLVAPRAGPVSQTRRSARAAFLTRSSKRVRLAARSAFPRQVPPERCLRSPRIAARHRTCGFATAGRLPTRFRPPSARAGGARPERRGRIHSAWAKRRLSTSAIESNREHDHVIARTPLTQRAVARAQSCSRPPPIQRRPIRAGGHASFEAKPTELPQARSRGGHPRHFLPRSLAGRALSRPALLGHLLSPTRDPRWLGAPAPTCIRRCLCEPAWRQPLSQPTA